MRPHEAVLLTVLAAAAGAAACGGTAATIGSTSRDAAVDVDEEGGGPPDASSPDSVGPAVDGSAGVDASGPSDGGAPTYAALAVGAGSNGLQLVGLQTGSETATLAGHQSPSGTWTTGGPLPDPSVALRSIATAQGASGGASALQVLGIGATDGHAYVGCWQDGAGAWHAGAPLPGPSTTLSAVATGAGTSGGSPALQVVGLGANDGLAYLVAWQDSAGTWTSGGGLLTSQTTPVSAITTGVGVSNGLASLQVVGLGAADGQVYVVGWQDGQGGWNAGGIVAGQTAPLSAIATGNGTTNLGAGGAGPALQVVGLAAGSARVAAWQDPSGTWHAGGVLPAAPVPLTAIATASGNRSGSPTLEVFGLGTDERVYVVAWQDSSGNWNAGQALAAQAGVSAFVVGAGWNAGSSSLQVIGLSAEGRPSVVAQQDSVGDWIAGASWP